ncbi:MAG TPA: sugar transferase [Candidatus Polarisedimenticolia bacterium]|nr:sugar transferase [Candidatus Polarisedimenticolia bacterium]
MTERGEAYCRGRLKRGTDFVLSALALVVLSPVFVLLAVAVIASSGRPILFRQDRIGVGGRPFRLFKFRTMRPSPGGGLLLTGCGDRRVTGLGRFLRTLKLDELPQLVNVLMGDMSLVGPRPEVARYVDLYTPEQRRILRVRPGLTDPATIQFRDEETLLGAVAEDRREAYYVSEILPRKLAINLEYVKKAGLLYDLRLMAGTVRSVLSPSKT